MKRLVRTCLIASGQLSHRDRGWNLYVRGKTGWKASRGNGQTCALYFHSGSNAESLGTGG